MKKRIIYFRESFIQSLLSDIVTFGLLFISIYISRHSWFWSIITLSMLVITLFGMKEKKNKKRRIEFTDKEELIKYLQNEQN